MNKSTRELLSRSTRKILKLIPYDKFIGSTELAQRSSLPYRTVYLSLKTLLYYNLIKKEKSLADMRKVFYVRTNDESSVN